MADLDSLQQKLGVRFNDAGLLAQALVHSSYVNECPEQTLSSNERMEFLGDAVLGLVLADRLYKDFPGLTEGGLTRRRARLVCRDCLVRVAHDIGLGNYLCLGRGEEASGGRSKPANLAAAVEAVIATIYLDQGLKGATEAIFRLFRDELIKSEGVGQDYKSRLQELVQDQLHETPVYITAANAGGECRFTAEVRVQAGVLGRGSGGSKKEAETAAAQDALEHKGGFTPRRSV